MRHHARLTLACIGLTLLAPLAAQELKLKSQVSVKKLLPGRVAFSPDGKTLAVSGQTGEGSVEPKAGGQFSLRLTNVERVIVLVDAGSFKVRKELMKEPDGDIFGSSPVEFSADGQRLFTLANGSIRVWDTRDGKKVSTWGQKIARLVFSPDRRYALARLLEGNHEAYDLLDGRSLGAFPKSEDGELLIADAERLYSAFFREPNVVLRNLKTGEESVLGESALKRLTGAALSPDARSLAVTGESGAVSVWGLNEKKKLAEQPASGGDGAYGPVFAPDGSALAYRAGKKLRYWGLHSNALVTQDPQHVMALGKVSFGNDAQTLVTTGLMMDPVAKIWTVVGSSVGASPPAARVQGQGEGFSFTVDRSGNVVAASGSSGDSTSSAPTAPEAWKRWTRRGVSQRNAPLPGMSPGPGLKPGNVYLEVALTLENISSQKAEFKYPHSGLFLRRRGTGQRIDPRDLTNEALRKELDNMRQKGMLQKVSEDFAFSVNFEIDSGKKEEFSILFEIPQGAPLDDFELHLPDVAPTPLVR